MGRSLVAVLVFFAAMFFVAVTQLVPPAPLPADAPRDRFSAQRARTVQKLLVGDGTPRPTGSESNTRARNALVAELKRLGYKPETTRSFSCGKWGSCAFVTNIVATRAAREANASAILVGAHYDSVAASPGASDDGLGVAALVETARALAEGPALERPIVFVLTDGEESGLLGAEAFAREHPLAKTIKAAINVDARGDRGPSALFEASQGNAWLVAAFAKNATRPVTSSLFYEVYRRMPNDTDFTVWKRFAKGVNFASIAGIEGYHTPLDSIENSDLRTLQHHGDNVLAMARALATAPEVDAPPSEDAGWFDFLSITIVRWPLWWTLPAAIVALALALFQAVKMRGWGFAVLASLGSLLGGAAATFVVGLLLRALDATPTPWVAHPAPALVSLHSASIAGGLAVAITIARARGGADPRTLWAGTWTFWGVLGVVAAIVAPGAAHVFVVPTLIAGVFAWLGAERGGAVASCAAAVMWTPLGRPIYEALGFGIPVLTGIVPTLLVSTLCPLLVGATRRMPLGFMSVAIVGGMSAAFAPAFSPEHPQRVNVVYREDHLQPGMPARGSVLVDASWGPRAWGRPPAAMMKVLRVLDGSDTSNKGALPWSPSGPSANVDAVGLEPVAFEIASPHTSEPKGVTRTVRIHIRSQRGAPTLIVGFPELADAPKVTVRGQTTPLRGKALLLRAVPKEGIDVELELPGVPVDVLLQDVSDGVPAGPARQVVAARPPEAAQSQEGDVTMTSVHLEL